MLANASADSAIARKAATQKRTGVAAVSEIKPYDRSLNSVILPLIRVTQATLTDLAGDGSAN